MAARQRALDRGYRGHAHPSHAIRAYTAATNEDIFSTQYAVRSTQYICTKNCASHVHGSRTLMSSTLNMTVTAVVAGYFQYAVRSAQTGEAYENNRRATINWSDLRSCITVGSNRNGFGGRLPLFGTSLSHGF